MKGPGRIYDITRPLAPGSVVYPGDIVPRFRQRDHGQYLVTDIRLSTHSGTHIDAPAHYFDDGASIDQVPLASLMGWCRVVDLSGVDRAIVPSDLEGKLGGPDKLLMKTPFSEQFEFEENYPALTPEAAEFLAVAGITCIGTDTPSIEEFGGNGDVHRTLLSNGTIIIELLDLHEVREGDYWMIALPLRLRGLDGSPCRALLFEGQDSHGHHH
jgi:arylformamidase